MNLETERLLLRPWEESVAQEQYRHARDERIGPAAGWSVHTSVENSLEIIKKVLAVPETYAVILKETGLPIGSVGLKMGTATDMTDRDDEAEIGYWLGVPYWGQGLMPEAVRELQRHAFEDMGLQRLWCGYYDGNEKSRRVQEKCGFRYHHTTEGLYLPLLDEIRTGHASVIHRSEWKAMQG